MKKKINYLFFGFLVCLALCIIPNISKAAVDITRNIYSNNGSMKFQFSGLSLDKTHEYEFGLTKTTAQAVETWHLITEYTENSATVDISTTTKDLREVINAVDTGYITIKDKTADNNVLEPTAVDLKTPFLQVANYTVISNGKNIDSSDTYIRIAMRCASNSEAYYQYEKITDTRVINKYNELKANNGNYLELQSMLKENAPMSNWQPWKYWNGYDYSAGMNGFGCTQRDVSVPDTGLYYMWLYFSGENVKPMYGCILVDNLEGVNDNEKPTVKSISVYSPASGTYKTGQTVKIWVTFSEPITGEVPTLKIKFGNSEIRSLTNGTIRTDTIGRNQIEYAYDIQNGDVGQLATVDLTGGNIKDEAGNEANLSCPLINGNTIKANVDGTTTTETENQDKQKDEKGNEENNGTEEKKEEEKKDTETGKKEESQKEETGKKDPEEDNTQAKDNKLPYTGKGITIVMIMLGLAIVATVAYSKFRYLKEV